MTNLDFCKMHGLGNDFIVIDSTTRTIPLSQQWIQQIADRNTGIGFDQLLLITASKKADFGCKIFNADGSEAEQCGNGLRCVARFILEKKLSHKKSLTIETMAGIIPVIIHDFDRIEVNMGIPFIQDSKNQISLASTSELSVISMGNPHAILKVNSINQCPVSEWGQKISASFENGSNAGFMEIVNRQHIRLRTFERGVGETLACGSNACAAVVAGIQDNLLDKKVQVELPRGSLWVEWTGKNSPVLMTGPAALVFEGKI